MACACTERCAGERSVGGCYNINIALSDRIEQAAISGVELYNPAVPGDQSRILQAIAESDELATALPRIAFYDPGAHTSVARTLADGLTLRNAPRPAIVYTAENHNHASALLREAVANHCPASALANVQFLNTVIGKMFGVITDAGTIAALKLATLTPVISKAVLVEDFNRILISQITLPGFKRGIDVFVEKPDLLPFEEAKLYGHNAVHVLIACLAAHRRLNTMTDTAAVHSLLSHCDSLGKAVANLPRPTHPRSEASLEQILPSIWPKAPAPEAADLIDLTWEAINTLRR